MTKKIEQPKTITLLDRGCEFHGKLSFEGVVRIDGSFEGEIFSQDHLIIGEGAKVHATIQVGKLEVSGSLEGKILASDELIVHSPSVIKGEIETKSLQVASGAVIDASIQMSELQNNTLEKAHPSVVPFGARPPEKEASLS